MPANLNFSLVQAMMITMQDKMKDMEDREITLKADKEKLKSDMEVIIVRSTSSTNVESYCIV